MSNEWKQLATVIAEDLNEQHSALARRLAPYFPKCEGLDSVQFWRDGETNEVSPFVLLTLGQVRQLWKRASGAKRLVGFAHPINDEQASIAQPSKPTDLRRKLAKRLTQDVPELRGATNMVFARTRTRTATECKWIADLTRGDEVITVGSLIPARDLVKGRRRVGVVGHQDGRILIGYSGAELETAVASLVSLGLYNDEVKAAIARAQNTLPN